MCARRGTQPSERDPRHMFGSLGYIDTGRRTNGIVDASIIGTTKNTARRWDALHGVRPAVTAVSMRNSSNVLLEKRCDFLEEVNRSRAAELSDLRAQLADAHVESVTGTVLAATRAVRDIGEESASTSVPAGEVLRLVYPMKKVRVDDAQQVWMKRRRVCADTAQVTYDWVLLFEEGETDTVYVANFC